jgi:hypothetical protein
MQHKNPQENPEKSLKNPPEKNEQKTLEYLSGKAGNKEELDTEKQTEAEQIKFESVIGRTEFTAEELAETAEKDQQVLDLMKHLAKQNAKKPLSKKDLNKLESSLS